jgi:hypothetical protein
MALMRLVPHRADAAPTVGREVDDGVPVSPVERDRILGERDPARLGRWIARAIGCTSVAELLSER